jgi:hypothetical protein
LKKSLVVNLKGLGSEMIWWAVNRQSLGNFDFDFDFECSAVKRSEELVGELVRELQFSPCELLLLETGSWGTGMIREPRVKQTSAVGRRYQATTSGNCNRLRTLVCVTMNCKVESYV